MLRRNYLLAVIFLTFAQKKGSDISDYETLFSNLSKHFQELGKFNRESLIEDVERLDKYFTEHEIVMIKQSMILFVIATAESYLKHAKNDQEAIKLWQAILDKASADKSIEKLYKQPQKFLKAIERAEIVYNETIRRI